MSNKIYLGESVYKNYLRKGLIPFLRDFSPEKKDFLFYSKRKDFKKMDKIMKTVLPSFYCANHSGKKSYANIIQGRKVTDVSYETSKLFCSSEVHPASWFKVEWAYEIVRELVNSYKVEHIFDPFAGWGVRACGALLNEISYTGVDLNPLLIRELNDFFKDIDSSELTFIRDDSFLNYREYDNISYDAIFTCPPYWKAEDYGYRGRVQKSYKLFLKELLELVVYLMERPSVKVAAVCIEDFYYDSKHYCLDEDFKDVLNGLGYHFYVHDYASVHRHRFGDIRNYFCFLINKKRKD